MFRVLNISALACARSCIKNDTTRFGAAVFSKRFASSDVKTIASLAEEVEGLKRRMQTIEDDASTNALVSFYSSRPTPHFDVKSAVKRCMDPEYNADIFCHKYLPVILARTISALDALPLGLCAMPSILKVRRLYLETFNELINCDLPTDEATGQKFREKVMEIEEKRSQIDILQSMAVGVLQLRDQLFRHRNALVSMKQHDQWRGMTVPSELAQYAALNSIQEPLDACNQLMVEYNFLSRMLLNLDGSNFDTRVGMVDMNMDLERVVRNAVDDAKQICSDHYGDCPDVVFEVKLHKTQKTFPHMSSTIRYIVVELMKNSFRATVDANMERNSSGIVTCDNMPPVHVLICFKDGAKHACVCISDEGRGMTQQNLQLALAYSYTTASKAALTYDEERGVQEAADGPSPLAGYGYGLPMSRLYARSFDGDLVLQTVEGFGTSVYFYIKV